MSNVPETTRSEGFGFFRADGVTPLRSVDLRHLGADRFALLESFVYRGPSGQWLVTQDGLPDTDLVSVPWFLRWFVPPYGPHLLAALTHDWLLRNQRLSGTGPGLSETDAGLSETGPGTSAGRPMSRQDADAIFNEALGVSRIPRLRRAMMTAAVVFSTRFGTGGWARAGIALWLVLSAIGVFVTANSLARWWEPSWWNQWLVWVAAVAPVVASALWGSQWRSGIVGGYSVLLLAPASIVIILTAGVYSVLEWLVPGYNRAPQDLRELAASDTDKSS